MSSSFSAIDHPSLVVETRPNELRRGTAPIFGPFAPYLFASVSILTLGQVAIAESIWNESSPVPTAAQLHELSGVEYRVIKRYEPDVDQFDWLHGVALARHGDRLFASFGHNHGKENTATEVANYTVSDDGGQTWSQPKLIDDGEADQLAVSHGVFLSHAGELWAFHGAFYSRMRDVHTRAYRWDDRAGRWQAFGEVIVGGFWPMQEPRPMQNGNWVMAGLQVDEGIGRAHNPAAVAICDGTDFRRWQLVSIPRPTELPMWGESTVLVDGPNLTNIARGRRPFALVSRSDDFGNSWTVTRESKLPMAASKPYAGRLSTGHGYLIGNTSKENNNRRWPLTIALTPPQASQLERVFRIRNAIHKGPGESHHRSALSYPYAIEHDGKLFVGYSNDGGRGANRNSAELAIIPISSLTGRE